MVQSNFKRKRKLHGQSSFRIKGLHNLTFCFLKMMGKCDNTIYQIFHSKILKCISNTKHICRYNEHKIFLKMHVQIHFEIRLLRFMQISDMPCFLWSSAPGALRNLISVPPCIRTQNQSSVWQKCEPSFPVSEHRNIQAS